MARKTPYSVPVRGDPYMDQMERQSMTPATPEFNPPPPRPRHPADGVLPATPEFASFGQPAGRPGLANEPSPYAPGSKAQRLADLRVKQAEQRGNFLASVARNNAGAKRLAAGRHEQVANDPNAGETARKDAALLARRKSEQADEISGGFYQNRDLTNDANRRENTITDVNADLGRANAGFRRALTGTEEALRSPRVTGARLDNMRAEALMPPEVERAYEEANKTNAEADATRQGASLAKDQVTHYRAIADDARQLAAERRQGQAQQAREAGQAGFRPRTGEDLDAAYRTIEENQGEEAAKEWLRRQTGTGTAAPSTPPLPAGFEQYGSAPASVAAPGANVTPMGFEQFTTAPQARPAAPSVYPAVPEFASLNRPRTPSITDPTGDRAASHAREVVRQTGGGAGAFSFNRAVTDPRELDKLTAAAGTSDRIHDDRTSDRLNASAGGSSRVNDQRTVDALNERAGVGSFQSGGGMHIESAAAGLGRGAGGGGRPLDAQSKARIWQAAGGDKRRAIELAVQQGFDPYQQ